MTNTPPSPDAAADPGGSRRPRGPTSKSRDRIRDATAPGAVNPDAGPPPIRFTLPAEVTVAVGSSALDSERRVRIAVLSYDAAGDRLRARVRIVVGPGDHEVDLFSPGPPIDVDGIAVRLVRINGHGVVLTVARGNGWSPLLP